MELVCMVEVALSKGSVLTMKDIHDGYDALLEEHELNDVRARMSQRKFLKELIKGKIESVVFEKAQQRNESERLYAKDYRKEIMAKALNAEKTTLVEQLATLRNATEILRSDILKFNKQHKFQFKGAAIEIPDGMPDSLLSFHQWILASRRELMGQRESSLKQLTREMSCLMLYNTKTERQAAYKSKDEDRSYFQSRNENEFVVGMSLAVRKRGRKSTIVDMLHKCGLAISNGRCLLYETAIANAVIKRMQENQGMFIPSNCMKGARPVFHLDNADWNEDRLQTTHNLLLVGFQESDPAKFILDVNIPKSPPLNPNNFGELLPCNQPSKNQFHRQKACSNYVISQDKTISQACYEESTLPWIVACSVGSELAEREQGGSKTEESTSFGIEVEDSDKNDQGKSADAYSLIEENAKISAEKNDGTINMMVRSESEKTTLASDVPSWFGYNSLLGTILEPN
eukprot:gene4466-5059_t